MEVCGKAITTTKLYCNVNIALSEFYHFHFNNNKKNQAAVDISFFSQTRFNLRLANRRLLAF